MTKAKAELKPDGSVTHFGPGGHTAPAVAGIDWAKVDATTEAEISRQAAQDDAEAALDAAAYARRVRRKVGLSQSVFARKVGVPVSTVRNWEQGTRSPQGAARALLRVIDKAPETVLNALADE
ncbi:helix-turn-helix domain-containing protein [Azospirillum sp. SYSU D00513]|uniref:helix-turn-helix domain-containing protein n=1 Tax=Azospirillum sp. SYSU D00513 TaxID=2812561 RepID=UPI001A9695EC|nr:helix-turn-helix domain-containing protein [Azospirillum sp. SYSU D00513]